MKNIPSRNMHITERQRPDQSERSWRLPRPSVRAIRTWLHGSLSASRSFPSRYYSRKYLQYSILVLIVNRGGLHDEIRFKVVRRTCGGYPE